jgi:hypothetical protein
MTKKILNWGILSTAKINCALIKPLSASPRTRLLAAALTYGVGRLIGVSIA